MSLSKSPCYRRSAKEFWYGATTNFQRVRQVRSGALRQRRSQHFSVSKEDCLIVRRMAATSREKRLKRKRLSRGRCEMGSSCRSRHLGTSNELAGPGYLQGQQPTVYTRKYVRSCSTRERSLCSFPSLFVSSPAVAYPGLVCLRLSSAPCPPAWAHCLGLWLSARHDYSSKLVSVFAKICCCPN